MRSPTKLLAHALFVVLACTAVARAQEPSIATLDAHARASGNRKAIAMQIGQRLFQTEWPAQILKIAADSVDDVVVVGIRVSGEHFHRPLTRDAFAQEIARIASSALSTPHVNEVDVWAVVPIIVGKDVVVSGDLAVPTTKTVFTLTAVHGESQSAMLERMRTGNGVYWDEEWAALLGKGAR